MPNLRSLIDECNIRDIHGEKLYHLDAVFPVIAVNNGRPEFLGTGFHIADCGLVLTAAHILEEFLEEIPSLPGSPLQYRIRPSAGCFLFHYNAPNVSQQIAIKNAYFIRSNSNRFRDIAVGSLDNTRQPQFLHRLKMSLRLPKTGEQIFTYGFPQSSRMSDDGTFQMQPTLSRGVFEGISEDRINSGRGYCRVRMRMDGGASGSPVFNSQGEIWGICSSSFAAAGGSSDGWVLPIVEALPINLGSDYSQKTIETMILEGTIEARHYGWLLLTRLCKSLIIKILRLMGLRHSL